MDNKQFIKDLPKAELHLHLEGTLEPELMFRLAKRNGVAIPYKTIEEVREAYQFNCLQDFLDIYYAGASVLINQEDFYDLTYAYLERVHADGVQHVEVFFDPETHTQRDIDFSTIIQGIDQALVDAKENLGISSYLMMSFLRHLDQSSAFATLEQALPYKHLIKAVGLDSSELGNPPSKFKEVFQKAKAEGFLLVAHAGEEGPVDYIHQAINLLNVDRIDHGNSSLNSEPLLQELTEKKLALTLCPLSNLKLKVIDTLVGYPLRELQERGIIAMINSDDPAYFGGYLNQNYEALNTAINLNRKEIAELAKASFQASFLPQEKKEHYYTMVDHYLQHHS
jgi:adenosine deaminase